MLGRFLPQLGWCLGVFKNPGRVLPSRLIFLTCLMACFLGMASHPSLGEEILPLPTKLETGGRGVKYGTIKLFPRVSTGILYDSNIFLREVDVVSDIVYVASTGIVATKVRPRTTSTFAIDSYFAEYQDNKDDSFADVAGLYGLEHSITPWLEISAETGIARVHERRGLRDDDTPDLAAEPLVEVIYNAGSILDFTFQRSELQLGANYTKTDYSDVQLIDGTTADQDFRDEHRFGLDSNFQYDVSRYVSLINTARIEETEVRGGDGGPDRDAMRYTVRKGAKLNLSPKFSAQFTAGFLLEDFEDPTLGTSSWLPTYEGIVIWNPNRLLNIRLGVLIGEAGVDFEEGFGSSVFNEFSGQIIYTPNRRLTLTFDADYREETEDDPGLGDGRNFDTILLNGAVEYRTSRNFALRLEHRHEERISSDVLDSFKTDIVQFSLVAER